jgi:thiamine-phosphate pyrophosphorylase
MIVKNDLSQCRLYGFVDTAYLAGRKADDVARMLVEGGADIIQLRAKKEGRRVIISMAKAILSVTRPAGVILIINDFPSIAREVGADGVHLGQEDLEHEPITEVRSLLGSDKIIGISTHSLDQALAAEKFGADYIGVGPIFPTGTKPGRAAVGTELIRQVASSVRIPFVCIGGINQANVFRVKNAGAKWIAVVSAILNAADVPATARHFKAAIN